MPPFANLSQPFPGTPPGEFSATFTATSTATSTAKSPTGNPRAGVLPRLGMLALLPLAWLSTPALAEDIGQQFSASHQVLEVMPDDNGPGSLTLSLTLTNTGNTPLDDIRLSPLPGPMLMGHSEQGPEELLVGNMTPNKTAVFTWQLTSIGLWDDSDLRLDQLEFQLQTGDPAAPGDPETGVLTSSREGI